MAVEQYGNQAQALLDGGINAAVTSLDVDDASEFPSTGAFRIIIDLEILLVTGVAGNTFTVTRGAEGTTATTHANGATVTQIITRDGLQALGTVLHARDTFANLDAATLREGVTGWPTNSGVILRHTDAARETWGPIFKFTRPVDGDFAWVNQGAASLDLTHGGILLEAPATAGTQVRLRVKTAPATPYTITAAFIPSVPSNASIDPGLGLCWRESSTGEFVAMAYTITGTTGPFVRLQKWTNETTFSAGYTLAGGEWDRFDRFREGPVCWWQISDDGVNLIARVSNDGFQFRQVASKSRTDFMASGPDQVGFWAHPNGTTIDCSIWLLSWAES